LGQVVDVLAGSLRRHQRPGGRERRRAVGDERFGCLDGYFLRISPMSRWFLASALACLSARFSLIDLLAFLAMCCRGDLSAMAVLPALGSLDDSVRRQYAVRMRATPSALG
jgi:hypothetical protein